MADLTQYDFVPKKITISIWGMDAELKPFTTQVKTRQLAERAVELEFSRLLAMGEIIGLGYKGQKSRFKVVQSFLFAANTYRITLEDMGTTCMWREEMASPDVEVPRGERRRENRIPVVGSATLFNADGASSTAKLTDVSRSGCYVETFAPSPTGTEMHVILNLEGRSVDVTTVVRTCHPSIGMGMEIVGFASDEDRERLRGLVESLETA